MELKSVLKRVVSNSLTWRHVDDLPCVHTFMDNYYINLCCYKYEDKFIISINVDDIHNNVNDIIDMEFNETTSEYRELKPIYDKAIKEGIQIPSTEIA
ncbi:MAG: hypothetical protein ACK5UE_13260 [Chitinophagales bacterium]|jgi:hypothetical protein|nr:hypothetical protein [Sphingobacteriales bacterium]